MRNLRGSLISTTKDFIWRHLFQNKQLWILLKNLKNYKIEKLVKSCHCSAVNFGFPVFHWTHFCFTPKLFFAENIFDLVARPIFLFGLFYTFLEHFFTLFPWISGETVPELSVHPSIPFSFFGLCSSVSDKSSGDLLFRGSPVV